MPKLKKARNVVGLWGNATTDEPWRDVVARALTFLGPPAVSLRRLYEVIVARSISGHLTVEMGEHYSTVNSGEQRAALAKVIRLFAPGTEGAGGEYGGEYVPAGGEEKQKAGHALA